MKLSGIAGKGSGRVGTNVYAVSGGVQVVRQYNPNVTNPSTPAQVAQRSRLKLASQVAAAMADVIAIPKSGLVSSRNAFMKRNFDLFVGSEDGASCQYAKLQLTASSIGLPAVNAEKSDEQTLSIELTSDARAVATRVIYNVFAKTTEQQLMKIASRVVTEAGENGTFPIEVTTSATELVVYAYGMRDMSTTATAKYGNYHVQSGEDIAKLVANRKLSAADFNFTQTQGFVMGEALLSGTIRVGDPGAVHETFSDQDIINGELRYTYIDHLGFIEIDKILNANSVEASFLNNGERQVLPFTESTPGIWTLTSVDDIYLPVEIYANGKILFTIVS